jgi:hypothetical protein
MDVLMEHLSNVKMECAKRTLTCVNKKYLKDASQQKSNVQNQENALPRH